MLYYICIYIYIISPPSKIWDQHTYWSFTSYEPWDDPPIRHPKSRGFIP